MCCNIDRAIIAHPRVMRATGYLSLIVTALLKGKAAFSTKTLTFKKLSSLRRLKLGSVSPKLHLPCCNILKIPGASGLEGNAWRRLLMTWKVTDIYPH